MEITYAQSRGLTNPCYIDVRSPKEYEADHIPGAINQPLFNDEQREEIGRVYKQISKQQARFIGLDIAAARLPALLRYVDEIDRQGGTAIIYCWRGGMRSQGVYATARLMDIPCYRLTEGYKDYRGWVNNLLGQPLEFPLIVLHGLTGCGKTEILQLLHRDYGLQTIDLEGLACHRGSVFGHIGLAQQPEQKHFESLLAQAIAAYDKKQPLIVECESRRIGRLLLPEPFFAAMQNACSLLLYDSPENRIQRLLADYQPRLYTQLISQALLSPPLRKKFGLERLKELDTQARAGNYAQVVDFLLTRYYDPLYHYPQQPSEDYQASFCTADIQEAAAKIAEFVKAMDDER